MIKVFYLMTAEYVIGTAWPFESDKDVDIVRIQYPARVSLIQQGAENAFHLTPMLAPFLKDFRRMMECFPLKESLIVLEDFPADDLLGVYGKFEANMKRQFSGLILPKDGIAKP